MTDALKNAQRKYRKKVKQFVIGLRRDTDADIIAWLDSTTNASGAVKDMIRMQIAIEKKKK